MTDETPDYHVPYAEPKDVRVWESHERYQRALLVIGIVGIAGGLLILAISYNAGLEVGLSGDASAAAAAGLWSFFGGVLIPTGVLAMLLFLHVRAFPPR